MYMILVGNPVHSEMFLKIAKRYLKVLEFVVQNWWEPCTSDLFGHLKHMRCVGRQM